MVRRIRKIIDRDMQSLRLKLLKDLEQVFDLAKNYVQAGTEIHSEPAKILKKALGVTGDIDEVTPKQRQIWIRVMAYTGQVMNSLTKSFDESQVTKDLERLEKMINEAMAKEKTGRPAAAS